jgi:hypothetical protein
MEAIEEFQLFAYSSYVQAKTELMRLPTKVLKRQRTQQIVDNHFFRVTQFLEKISLVPLPHRLMDFKPATRSTPV